MYKSLIILLGSLLLTGACGAKQKPSAEPKLSENKEGSPKGSAPEDTGAKVKKLEQLKAHQSALARAGISEKQLTELFTCWGKTAFGWWHSNGPLYRIDRKPARKRALNAIQAALPSLTAFIQTDLNKHNAAATVNAITNKASYQALQEAAEVFLTIAQENGGEHFFNGRNGYGWGNATKHDRQGAQATEKPFIAYMKALQAFAKAAPFSE